MVTLSSASRVRIALPKSAVAGLMLVVGCGVACRYCLYERPSSVAALMHFPNVFIKRSNSALALCQYGVIRLCLKPR